MSDANKKTQQRWSIVLPQDVWAAIHSRLPPDYWAKGYDAAGKISMDGIDLYCERPSPPPDPYHPEAK